ncbi:hypothetical protein D3C79_1009420 [compost metagenome]
MSSECIRNTRREKGIRDASEKEGYLFPDVRKYGGYDRAFGGLFRPAGIGIKGCRAIR